MAIAIIAITRVMRNGLILSYILFLWEMPDRESNRTLLSEQWCRLQ